PCDALVPLNNTLDREKLQTANLTKTRNPKSEGRKKPEGQNPKNPTFAVLFGFLVSFGLRISDFEKVTAPSALRQSASGQRESRGTGRLVNRWSRPKQSLESAIGVSR